MTTSAVWRTTVGDLIKRSARKYGPRLALRFESRSWSYAQLDAASDRVAAQLQARGLSLGDRVAAFGKNSDAYLLLWLGCAKAGLVHVPVNFALFGKELAYIVEQSRSAAIFADEALVPVAREALGPQREIGTLRGGSAADVLAWARDEKAPRAIEREITGETVAQLLYTSGTTAAPKGAVMTHSAFVHHYASAALALDLAANETHLNALPLYHSAQMHVFLMPQLMMGAKNILLEGADLPRVLTALEKDAVDGFFAPPTVWIALLAALEKDPSPAGKLKKAFYGAATMPVPVLQKLRALLPSLGFYNCFGQSEIGPLATVLKPDEHEARPASAGRAVPFVELRVVDDDLNDVPAGGVGEVVYRSPQLCLGYFDKPGETAEAFAGGWFHSGDLAAIDAEGFITIVDRKKDVIKTGGIMVSSREVEEALFSHPAVREVAVFPLADPRWIEKITAVVVKKEGAQVDAEALVAWARTRLAPFKVPKSIFFADQLPKNASGKLLKRVLRDQYKDA